MDSSVDYLSVKELDDGAAPARTSICCDPSTAE